MSSEQWLLQQQQLYINSIPQQSPNDAVHPVSGIWQDSNYLKSVYWWGGRTTQETNAQISEPLFCHS
ncbi:hypothetical protein NON20_24290 (plasmid) [Synechocystis sp. B12]|nr:hypothetical protein NON20_24290 [Synechocystis sp. B12]